jgi:hypothetical protein
MTDRAEAVVVAKPGSPLPAPAVPVWLEPAEPVHPCLSASLTALERAERPVVPGALAAFGDARGWWRA